MMMKIPNLSQNKKKYLINLQMKRIEKISDLDKKKLQ